MASADLRRNKNQNLIYFRDSVRSRDGDDVHHLRGVVKDLVFGKHKGTRMGSLANRLSGDAAVTVYINQEKHTFGAADDLTQSLNDYLRRKTRFKVDRI
jgi:hypothetical protein